MTSIQVREAVIEGMKSALGKLEAEQAQALESPLQKKERRLREAGTSTEEEQYKLAKRRRKQAKHDFEESVSVYRRIGLSEAGAQAAARGRRV